MSILTVNLKHFYQRRSLWLVYLALGLVAYSFRGEVIGSAVGKGHYVVPVALEFIIGIYTASMPIQILTKPFTYCLPSHGAVPRKFVFWAGAATSLLGALVLPGYSSSWWQRSLLTCSLFCAGWFLYLLGAALVFGVRNSGPIIGLSVWLLFGGAFLDLHVFAERVILGHPFPVILLGLAGSVAAWIWFGKTNWSRQFCGISRLGMLDVWDQDKIRLYTRKQAASRWDKLRNHPEPWVERLFLSRMKKCNHLGPGRQIWGGLYTTYAVALSGWKKALPGLLIALAFVLCLCYWRPAGTNMLLLMVSAMAVNIPLPVHSCLAMPGGRNERFLTAIVLAGSITVLVTAALAVMVVVSFALAPIMPDVTLRGAELSFQPMSAQLLMIPAIIVPIGLAFRLVVFRYPYSTFASISVVAALVFGFGVVSSGILGRLFNPTTLAGLLILGWLALVLVLWHTCTRRSLVGQTRGH